MRTLAVSVVFVLCVYVSAQQGTRTGSVAVHDLTSNTDRHSSVPDLTQVIDTMGASSSGGIGGSSSGIDSSLLPPIGTGDLQPQDPNYIPGGRMDGGVGIGGQDFRDSVGSPPFMSMPGRDTQGGIRGPTTGGGGAGGGGFPDPRSTGGFPDPRSTGFPDPRAAGPGTGVPTSGFPTGTGTAGGFPDSRGFTGGPGGFSGGAGGPPYTGGFPGTPPYPTPDFGMGGVPDPRIVYDPFGRPIRRDMGMGMGMGMGGPDPRMQGMAGGFPGVPQDPRFSGGRFDATTGGATSIPDQSASMPTGGISFSVDQGAPSGGMPTGGMPTGGMPTGGMGFSVDPGAPMPMGGMPPSGMPTGGMPTGGMLTGGMPAGGMPTGGDRRSVMGYDARGYPIYSDGSMGTYPTLPVRPGVFPGGAPMFDSRGFTGSPFPDFTGTPGPMVGPGFFPAGNASATGLGGGAGGMPPYDPRFAGGPFRGSMMPTTGMPMYTPMGGRFGGPTMVPTGTSGFLTGGSPFRLPPFYSPYSFGSPVFGSFGRYIPSGPTFGVGGFRR